MKVVVIDDEPDVIEVVSLCLELRWPDITVLGAETGERGVDLVGAETPDLVILDIGLPGMSGFEVVREIRSFSDVPIVMLSVRGEDTDIVKGLELGADDYITKPFSHIELLARIQALLRRIQPLPYTQEEQLFVSGNLTVDFATREVRVNKELIKLTPIEYNLLQQLIRNEGRVLTHKMLLQKVWGPEYTSDVSYVKVYIQRLRSKLEAKMGRGGVIVSERGVGYKFVKLQ